MPDRNLILSLAKVAIATAWADGEITQKEINSVKEVLMRLPNSGGKSGPQSDGARVCHAGDVRAHARRGG